MYWAISLCKAGYGAVDLILKYDSDIFMNIMHYETFLNDYGREAQALREEKNG